tara:strand:- start:1246 stop:1806 length:561 start_codon:yes stop_codon:yes gene_type:complete
MTTKEFSEKLDKQIAEIVKTDIPLMIAVKSVMALQSKRIWLDAKNKSGSAIGSYVDKELYINPKNSPKKFQTKGKYGETKFANGEKHKTGYFFNYLDYKKKIGRNKNANTVNLQLWGELSRNWANGKISQAKANKSTVHKYYVSLLEHNYNKVERYGVQEVFGLSKFEKESFYKVINYELFKALTN